MKAVQGFTGTTSKLFNMLFIFTMGIFVGVGVAIMIFALLNPDKISFGGFGL